MISFAFTQSDKKYASGTVYFAEEIARIAISNPGKDSGHPNNE